MTSEGESDGPLIPGQTRLHKTGQPRLAQEIRGDPESSDDERRSIESGSSDVEIISAQRSFTERQYSEKTSAVITLSDTEIDTGYILDESSDEDITEDVLQAYLEEEDARSEVGEVNLIDWMLNRTRTIGAGTQHRSSTRNWKPRKTKYAFDVMTGRGRRRGKERQMRLTFDKVPEHRAKKGFRPESTTNGKDPTNAFQIMAEAAKKRGRDRKSVV